VRPLGTMGYVSCLCRRRPGGSSYYGGVRVGRVAGRSIASIYGAHLREK